MQHVRRGRIQHTFRSLPFRRVGKHRSSTQTERVNSSSRDCLQPDLRRREDLYTADFKHQEPPRYTRNWLNLKKQVLNLIVTDLQTLSLVDEEGFQLLLNALHPCINASLNASWIQTELLKMYDGTRGKVLNAVKNAKDLVLSADLWVSSKEASYLTITCHFIDKHWDLKSYVLDTAHLLGEHTPDNIHRQLWRIAMDWGISEQTQVVVVNVDGMNKANPKSKWTYIQCFGYALNKVLREVIGNPDWRALLKKCRHIVEFLHRENHASWRRRLTLPPTLDWLPTLNMLEKIYKHWLVISEVFIDKQVENLWLNENERKMLSDAKEVFKVLKSVTCGLGKTGYMSVSNIIPILDHLQTNLETLKQSENQVAQILAEKCHYHFKYIKRIRWFTISTALDPRFESCVLTNTPEAEHIKAKIKEEICMHRCGTSNDAETILQFYSADGNISETLNPFEFWVTKSEKIFKELSLVAHKYLSVISTADPIEQAMQHNQSQINSRKCLATEDVNMMLFLNGNHKKI